MTTVRVWRFKLFDIVSNEYIVSSRYATREAIDRVKGFAIVGSDILVESMVLNADGMTAMGYRQLPDIGVKRKQ